MHDRMERESIREVGRCLPVYCSREAAAGSLPA